jgi:hypothetical protein
MMQYNQVAFNPSGYYIPTKPRLTKIGKLFIAILLIVIFEGAFRKWISSALTNPLVLLRDTMALYGIVLAIKSGLIKSSQVGTQILKLWTYFFLMWGLMQLLINQTSPFIFIIGARFWLLYLWFAYAASMSFTRYDFDFISKTVIFILLLMTPLAVMQSFLPPGAFLNKQVDGDESTVFRVTADIVRTTGTFSFTLGYTTLLALATPFVLALLAPGTKLWNRRWAPKFCLLALGVATIVSGSRGAIIFFGLLFSIYVLASLMYAKRSKRGATLLVLIGVTALVALIPYFFTRSTSASLERFESAAQSENIYDRVQSMFLGESGVYKNLPLMGHGIGVGTNFAGAVATGNRTFLLAETEAARTILEGGILGFAFIGLKLFVIVIGMRKSLSILKSSANTLPLLLWTTTSLALLSWSIIGQLTVNALGYLLLGLAIASLRLFSRKQ